MSSAERILITGAAGFIGQGLTTALIHSSPNVTLTLTDVIEPSIPAAVSNDASRITSVKSDLTDAAAITSLLSTSYSAVYLLHGLMSGGAEANLELGWRVNWDSHRSMLDHLRHHAPGTKTIFPSSLAVYGPSSASDVTSELTCPLPQSSYGAQKLMVETYINDFSRRGLLDGRIVRLPTVIVRPGAPSAAASSFASGIVREPLNGETSVLPVSRNLEMWVCSPQTVVSNLVFVKDIPKENFGKSRIVNLPGITVTVQHILDALDSVGGSKATSLIEEARDPSIEAIVGSWPAKFDISRATSLGMKGDVTLVETVKAFADSLKS
ncbi:uncharacterized protein JN550_003744 [Neoarthrinium moseri]|uniref:uncharacterized protein n=1 Tax=Neoarthrinium moseri TaxID=1658444 RepID=UPI001FDDDC78|nr:uncharacterized protein JN550_003744 [Neoarthrinium moseri]KAI1872870.1 hypothetical protein JN550_003744 [Neoarthrinium moseri]